MRPRGDAWGAGSAGTDAPQAEVSSFSAEVTPRLLGGSPGGCPLVANRRHGALQLQEDHGGAVRQGRRPQGSFCPRFSRPGRGTLGLLCVTVGWKGPPSPPGPFLDHVLSRFGPFGLGSSQSGGPSSEIRALRVWVLVVCPSSEIRPFRGLGSGGPSSEIRPLRSWVLGVLSQRLGLSGDWDLPGRDGESQEAL